MHCRTFSLLPLDAGGISLPRTVVVTFDHVSRYCHVSSGAHSHPPFIPAPQSITVKILDAKVVYTAPNAASPQPPGSHARCLWASLLA